MSKSKRSSVDPTHHILLAPTSPLIGDPEWIREFRLIIQELLAVAIHSKAYERMPSGRESLLVREYDPALQRLASHLKKVVDAGRNGPDVVAYTFNRDVDRAFQLACSTMEEVATRSTAKKRVVPLTALEEINKLLSHERGKPGGDRQQANANEARDEFIYSQRKQGVSNKQIMSAVNKMKGWAHLGTEQAVNNALNRYCERKALAKPTYKRTKIKHD